MKAPAVDQGWAWVVCGAVCFTQILGIGFSTTLGTYFVEFLHIFNQSKGTTSFISALNLGTFNLVGPLCSILIHKRGHRFTLFLGSLIASLGMLLSAFSPNLLIVILTLGVLQGVGLGMVYSSGVTTIGQYFVKYRPTALGIAMAGNGFGHMIYPFVTTFLIESYGWRGSLILTTGIFLNMCVGASLIFKDKIKPSGYSTSKIDIKTSKPSIKSINLELFSNINFILLTINTGTFSFGSGVKFTHISALTESRGMPVSFGSLLISLFGLCSMVGKIVLSGIDQHPRVNTFVLYTITMTLYGLSLIMLAFESSPTGMLVFACCAGFFYATFGPINAEVFYKVTKPHQYDIAYGYILLTAGFGYITGSPAAGYLYDFTQHYPNSFYMAGGVILLGVLVFLPAVFCSRTKDKSALYSCDLQQVEKLTDGLTDKCI